MTIAFEMKRRAVPANPHVFAGLGLGMALCIGALGVLLFGDPEAGAPRAVTTIPPVPARIAQAEPPASLHSRALRGEPLPEPESAALVYNEAPEPFAVAELALQPVEDVRPGFGGEYQTDRDRRAELPSGFDANSMLPPAPIAGLTEPGPGGPLPVISANGVRPADAYARPYQPSEAPPVAIIVGGLGWDPEGTRRAIRELPPEITLGFSPYAPNLQDWIDAARAAGYETIIEVPMEPFDYPQNDPGEHTLLTSVGAPANVSRLEWLMSRTTGYFGVMNYMGGKFLTSDASLAPVLSALAERGVDLVYDGAPARSAVERLAGGAGLEWAPTDRALDANLTAADVQNQLAQLEAVAMQNGAALGAGFAYPVVVDQVISWAREAELRGYSLAPASAVLAMKSAARTQ